MKKLLILGLITINFPIIAQRAHELQFQFGLNRNWGVAFYDYIDTGSNRHNFEFDQNYASEFYTVSWHYPINGYLEVGLFFSSSFEGRISIFEAESAVFNDLAGSYLRPDTLFVGLNEFETKYKAVGFDIRTTITRGRKIRSYAILTVGLQRYKNLLDQELTLQAQEDGIRNDIMKTYLVTEKKMTAGLGVGIFYPLKKGFNLKLLEIYGHYIPRMSTNMSAPFTIELRTGISYRFYERK